MMHFCFGRSLTEGFPLQPLARQTAFKKQSIIFILFVWGQGDFAHEAGSQIS